MEEKQQIEQAIRALEAQRTLLGDAVVDAAISPMREKLAKLGVHEQTEQQRKHGNQLKRTKLCFFYHCQWCRS